MPCFYPRVGYRGPGGQFVSGSNKSGTKAPMKVPCGCCIGCRMDRARDWGTRIALEASCHDESSFLTLTYSQDSYPVDGSVSVRDLQLFFKRLRKSIEPKKVRYYACGEYGDRSSRAHYHVILFGHQFEDLKRWRQAKSGHLLYRSEALEALWPFGHCEIGTVTRESGGYVARYCLKKIGGAPAAEHYTRPHPVTGLLVEVTPEFALMSRRPGIGQPWLDKFESDAFPSSFITINGKKVPVPRFFKNKLSGRFEFVDSYDDPVFPRDDLEATRKKAREHMRAGSADLTPERLEVRGELARLRQEAFKRDGDSE